MSDPIPAVETYARERAKPLSPQWKAELAEVDLAPGIDALAGLAGALGWPPPRRIEGRPRADQFPLLVHDPETGWSVARQWDSATALSLTGNRKLLDWNEAQRFFVLPLPDPLASDASELGGLKAVSVFWRAIGRRKQPLVMAGFATIFANILVLAVSLYSMQLYDRVIPLASFDTLVVLTAGVLFALLLDFALRSLRAILIEGEAQDIDAEISEFFFARAQAIRLDARPPGIGTLAAQLRGQEQVRAVLSSGSLFMLADLPFALFFILVIAAIGGPLAFVPIVSLPIALGLALLLGRIIRTGADRAQVSGNRKNGMLVESLDAAETVKSQRGGWLLMGRWNTLVREIHHYEDPVKRASAVAGSLFATLQQTAYVAIMGWGAWLAAQGQITTGALLACSIIAGRINGPLVAQLPNIIVQWSTARSSLVALDAIMKLPLDPSTAADALRPGAIEGGYRLEHAVFGYPGSGRPAVEIDRLEIAPGERVAIIGGIGSGKSTLLKLLAGLYMPRAGSALVGGLDLAHIAEDIARRHVGYLGQDARLVNGTLRDNLTMGLGDLTDGELLAVAGQTRLDALIAGSQEGLALPIEEGGRGLSGGQRSLVGINRLIHARPQIWLLDEPTAALDQATEKAALDAVFERLSPASILIMVTHKQQLLTRFGRIIVMAGGRIVRDEPATQLLPQLAGRAHRAPEGQDNAQAGVPAGTVTSSLVAGRRAS